MLCRCNFAAIYFLSSFAVLHLIFSVFAVVIFTFCIRATVLLLFWIFCSLRLLFFFLAAVLLLFYFNLLFLCLERFGVCCCSLSSFSFILEFMALLPFWGETVSECMVVCCNVIWLASVTRLLLVWFICAIIRFRVGCVRL